MRTRIRTGLFQVILGHALEDDEESLRARLAELDTSEKARLRNAALQLISLTEDRRGSWSS